MAQLSWVTGTGNIASLLVNVPASLELIVLDPNANINPIITYEIISGSLPDGMSLDRATGVIAGTPTSTLLDSSTLSKTTYNFIVRVTSQKFYSISSMLYGPTYQIVSLGSITTIPSSWTDYQKSNPLQSFWNILGNTYDAKNDVNLVTYNVGSTISVENNGIAASSINIISGGSVRIPKELEILDGAFTITLSNIVNNNFAWITPAGELGTIPNGEYYSYRIQAETNTGNPITYSFVSGELPSGMQLTTTGYLQGVPVFLNPVVVDQSQTYRFTIRATTGNNILDRSFSINVTNVYGPVIKPDSVVLGQFFDGSYFSQQLYVAELNPAVKIQWLVKEGSLPPGISLSSTGLLYGYIDPVELVGNYGPAGYDGINTQHIGATATLSNCTISGTSLYIGSYTGSIQEQMYLTGNGVATGTYIVGQLSNRVWTVTPAQSILSNTTITGTVLPNNQEQEYDYGPYDFNQLSQNVSYSFTIQAFDGANYDTQTYIMDVISRPGYTADSTNLVNNSFLTTDATNIYYPIIKNGSITTLPTGRQGSYYSYKFDGFDFNGDPVTYNISNTVGCFDTYVIGEDLGFDNLPFDSFDSGASYSINLPGISLDSNTGWLYGNLTTQSEAVKYYEFGVVVSKVQGNVKYSANPIYFTLPVLGDVNNTIQWITPSNLGSIDNGSVSELFVEASSPIGADLVYSIYDVAGQPAALPQGLSFLSTGEISGRVSFEAFTLDNYATTFDGKKTTVDRTYNFTVLVKTNDTVYASDGSILVPPSATSTREFTISLNIIDPIPYENLYLSAMTAFDQRQIYNSIISNTEIFDPAIIYRADDPWFGVQNKMQMLFAPGLSADTLDAYETAILENHWTKTYNFTNIKTASVLDDNYNVKYEVVYIEVEDPEENSSGNGPVQTLNLTNTIANPYIDANGNDYKIVHPNSSQNMLAQLEAGIGYTDQSSLPPWMTSNQPNPSSKSTFLPPLGYTKAVVVAYTKPGAAKLIAYRLKNSGITFSNIDFTVDRYEVDDYYTKNFNSAIGAYRTGVETTFDALPTINVGTIVAQVEYAVNIPFSEINGRPLEYINSTYGGVDGVTAFQPGDKLIFAKQENFSISAPYDGWVDYTDAYIGDNILTNTVEGYGSESFDTYTVIPGYLEYIQGTSAANQRGGIWQININSSNTVYLTFIKQVNPNDRIQVLRGKTYSGAILYYDKNYTANSGYSVPFYTVYTVSYGSVTPPTTFNKGTTKFFSSRDQYYTPGSEDKYLKFPQYGVFK